MNTDESNLTVTIAREIADRIYRESYYDESANVVLVVPYAKVLQVLNEALETDV